jgi:hypothetical protein
MSKKWTEEDIRLLKASLLVHPIPDAAKVLGRTVLAVKKKMTQMGFKTTKRVETIRSDWWTDREVETLKTWSAKGWSARRIARKIGKTEKAVNVKASNLRVSLNHQSWSESEVELLIQMYNEGASMRDISGHFERSVSACENKVKRLCLKRSSEWSREDVETLFRLKAGGESWDKIASELGRKRHAVMKKYHREKQA